MSSQHRHGGQDREDDPEVDRGEDDAAQPAGRHYTALREVRGTELGTHGRCGLGRASCSGRTAVSRRVRYRRRWGGRGRSPRRRLGQLPGEAVPAGDLERDLRDLPRPARRAQRAFDPADLQDEDGLAPRATARPTGTELTIPPSMKCSSPRCTGGSSPGTADARQDGVDERSRVEPVLGGPLDAGRAALERHRQVVEGGPAELRASAAGAAAPGSAGGSGGRSGPAAGAASRRRRCAASGDDPELGQAVGDPLVRGGGDGRAVERADRRADDQVGRIPASQQGPGHADLDRAEDAAAAEDEPDGAGEPFRHGSQRNAATADRRRTRRPREAGGDRPRSPGGGGPSARRAGHGGWSTPGGGGGRSSLDGRSLSLGAGTRSVIGGERGVRAGAGRSGCRTRRR